MKLIDLAYSVFNDGSHAILDFSDGKEIGHKTVADLCAHTSAYHNTSSMEFVELVKQLSQYSKVEINHGVLDTPITDSFFPIMYVAPSRKQKWRFIEGNGEKYAGDMKIVESDFKKYIELKREYLKQKLQKFRKTIDVKKLEKEILHISYEAEERSSDWGYLFAQEKDIILDRLIKKAVLKERAKKFEFTYGWKMEEEKKKVGVPSFTPIHIKADHKDAGYVFVEGVSRDNSMKYNVNEYMERRPEIKEAVEIARKHNAINEVIRHDIEFLKQIEAKTIEPKVVILNLNNKYFLDRNDLSWLLM